MSKDDSQIDPRDDTSMQAFVRQMTQQLLDVWWDCAPGNSALPEPEAVLGPSYARREQRERQGYLRLFLETVKAEARHPPHTAAQQAACQQRIFAALDALMDKGLGFGEAHRQLLLSPGYTDAAIQFAQAARHFDPTISGSAIFQASRNALAMNGIQSLMGLPIRLTPAIFAYSMLYPYTDNYLDDPTIAPDTKRAFVRRFEQRLYGASISPANAQERAIYDLVGMIEEQYDRATHPQVFASLLSIHHAQVASLRLLQAGAAPYEIDVLGISIAKGGTSVLADGYLVAGSLNDAQARCLFGYGAFLQLADDLQDVQEDRQNGLQTVFSQVAGRWPLDGLTSRAMSFGSRILEGLDAFAAPNTAPLKQLMRLSATQLLIDAVGRSRHLHTGPYVRALEAHSPFRFGFLAECRRRINRERTSLIGLIEAFALSGHDSTALWQERPPGQG
ncbi:MAG: hypothetical protein GX552_04170 [Chloroflexi bacterium]|nr:hypothetical protein [Chloroflexota bacterium]